MRRNTVPRTIAGKGAPSQCGVRKLACAFEGRTLVRLEPTGEQAPLRESGSKLPHSTRLSCRLAAEIRAFWDSHDFSDFEDRCPDVTDRVHVDIRRVRHYVAIEPEILRRAAREARKRGMSTEKLVNLCLEAAVGRR